MHEPGAPRIGVPAKGFFQEGYGLCHFLCGLSIILGGQFDDLLSERDHVPGCIFGPGPLQGEQGIVVPYWRTTCIAGMHLDIGTKCHEDARRPEPDTTGTS